MALCGVIEVVGGIMVISFVAWGVLYVLDCRPKRP